MEEDKVPTSSKLRQSGSRSTHPPGLSTPVPGRSASDKQLLEQVEGQQGPGQEEVEEVEPYKMMEANRIVDMVDDGGHGHTQIPTGASSWVTLPPLQNQVILSNLFRFCRPHLLANFRLVDRQWRDLSLPTWRDSFALRFVFQDGGILMTNGKPPIPLQDFLELEAGHSSSNPTPYRHYILDSFDYQLPNAREIFVPFWERVGKNLTTLELSTGTRFVDAEDFRKVIFKECPNLQRLFVRCSFPLVPTSREVYKETDYKGPVHGEHLHLKSLSVRLSYGRGQLIGRLPVSWLEIFSHFQSLTSLSVISLPLWDEVEDIETENMLGALAIANKKNPRKFSFKQFNARLGIGLGPTSFNKFPLIQQIRLPVHRLTIYVSPELDNKAVQGLLKSHSGGLRNIDVYVVGLVESYRWTFPCQLRLEALEELMMSSVILESMDFIKWTPNLKTLELTGSYSFEPTKMVDNSCKAHLEHVKLLKLEELRLECEIGTVEEVKSLARWMPNVKKLTMMLNNQQFAIVCENWTGLEELSVLGCHLTDEGVTGRLLEKPGLGVVHPNITSLQCLKKMKLCGKHITRASVQYGFLHLLRLETCEVGEAMELGPELRDALREKNIIFVEDSDW